MRFRLRWACVSRHWSTPVPAALRRAVTVPWEEVKPAMISMQSLAMAAATSVLPNQDGPAARPEPLVRQTAVMAPLLGEKLVMISMQSLAMVAATSVPQNPDGPAALPEPPAPQTAVMGLLWEGRSATTAIPRPATAAARLAMPSTRATPAPRLGSYASPHAATAQWPVVRLVMIPILFPATDAATCV